MIIKAPSYERGSHQSDALDEFASSQPDEERSDHKSAVGSGRALEGANPLEGPPLVPVYLTELEGLDAFDLEQSAGNEPAQVAQTRVAPPRFAASDMATAGTATAIRPTPVRTAATAPIPMVSAAPPRSHSSPVVLKVEIPRPTQLPTYLYASVLIAILMVLTAAFLTLPVPVPEPSSADQAVPTRNDASETLSTSETPDLIAAVPAPAVPVPAVPAPSAPLARENATRPIERSRIAGLAPPPPPVPRRVAPAASARAERETKPTSAALPSSPFPASQARSVTVPSTAVAPNVTAGSASGAAANTEAAGPPPRSVVAPSVTASAPAASTAAALPAPAPAAAATPSPATASNTSTPVSAAPTGANAPSATLTPATAIPPNAAPAASAVDIERGAVRQVLERYRTAINALDADAARKAWPGVNQRALARAFERLDEQDVSFQNCRIDVNRVNASAVCGGVVRYVPSIGSRTQRVEQREWTFKLRRQDNGWFIEGVGTR
jgi:hypothetical protein